MTLENCSILTFSRTTVPFASFLLVQWHLHDRALHLPSTNTADKFLKCLSLHSQPRLQHRSFNFSDSLRDCECDTDTNQFFKARDIGDEVRVEVIAIESAPEGSIGGLAEEVVENVEFLDGFREWRVACCRESGGTRTQG